MLSHAIEAGMYQSESRPLDNFELTLPDSQSGLAKDLHKDSLNFGFVSLEEGYTENSLRKQLVANLKRFLLEMGPDFLLKGEEVEVVAGGESGSIDLLLYNLALKCYFAIELKTGAFMPQDVGQLSFYVTVVDKLIKRPEDNPTVGIIICKEVNRVKAKWTLEGPPPIHCPRRGCITRHRPVFVIPPLQGVTGASPCVRICAPYRGGYKWVPRLDRAKALSWVILPLRGMPHRPIFARGV